MNSNFGDYKNDFNEFIPNSGDISDKTNKKNDKNVGDSEHLTHKESQIKEDSEIQSLKNELIVTINQIQKIHLTITTIKGLGDKYLEQVSPFEIQLKDLEKKRNKIDEKIKIAEAYSADKQEHKIKKQEYKIKKQEHKLEKQTSRVSKINNTVNQEIFTSKASDIDFDQEIRVNKLKNVFLAIEDKFQSITNYYQETDSKDFQSLFDQSKMILAHPEEGTVVVPPALANKFKLGDQVPVILPNGQKITMTIKKIQVMSNQQYSQFKTVFMQYGISILKNQAIEKKKEDSSNENDVSEEKNGTSTLRPSVYELKERGITIKKFDKINKLKNLDQILQIERSQHRKEVKRLNYLKRKKEEKEKELEKEKSNLETYESRMEKYKEDLKKFKVNKDRIGTETIKVEIQKLELEIKKTKQNITNVNKEVIKIDKEFKEIEKKFTNI